MKNIILTLLTLCFLSACSLSYEPENKMVSSTVYRDKNTAEAALLGAYVQFQNFLSGAPQGTNGYPDFVYAFLFGDLGTDLLHSVDDNADYVAVESSAYTEVQHQGILSTVYLNGYNTIDYANNIIEGIRRHGEFDPVQMRIFIAEAKFIRAYAYFQLLCLYGDQALSGHDDAPGLVLRLTPFDGYKPSDIQARATNREVWDLIIKDLEAAIPDLTDNVPVVDLRVRATKGVAQALLSRVLLYKGTATDNAQELSRCADLASSVLSLSAYKLGDTQEAYAILFPRNIYDEQSKSWSNPTQRSEELIFFEASRLTKDGFPSGIINYYNKSGIVVPEKAWKFYEEGDIRGCSSEDKGENGKGRQLIGIGSTTYHKDKTTSLKYPGYNPIDGNNDVIYIRLAEIYLNRAEALVRVSKSVSSEAIELLNRVHVRAFPNDSPTTVYKVRDFSTTEELLMAILQERRRELAYENHMRFDIIRTANMLKDSTMGAVPLEKWNLPYPTHEVRISDGIIVQNSGYR